MDKKIQDAWWQIVASYPSDTFAWNWDFKPPVPENVIRRGKASWEFAEIEDRIQDNHRKEMISQLRLAQNLMRVSPMMTYTFSVN